MSTSTIITHLATHKDRLTASLRNLLAYTTPSLLQAGLFFKNLFDICHLCLDSNSSIADQFNFDEKKELAASFRKGLPTIEQALITVHCTLDPSIVQELKKLRSSVQFLIDDFTFLDEFDEEQPQRLSELLKDIAKWDRVEMIDEELPYWDAYGGEFYIPVDPINLANIPESHSWWTETDRSTGKNYHGYERVCD